MANKLIRDVTEDLVLGILKENNYKNVKELAFPVLHSLDPDHKVRRTSKVKASIAGKVRRVLADSKNAVPGTLASRNVRWSFVSDEKLAQWNHEDAQRKARSEHIRKLAERAGLAFGDEESDEVSYHEYRDQVVMTSEAFEKLAAGK